MSVTYPVLPIRNTVVFPGLTLPLRVGRAKSVAAIHRATEGGDGYVLALAQTGDGEGREAEARDLHRVGTLVKIERMRGTDDQGYQVLIRGASRFRVTELSEVNGCIEARGELLPDVGDADEATRLTLLEGLKQISKEILSLLPTDTSQLSELVGGIEDLSYLSHLAAGNLELPVSKKQEILETVSVRHRGLLLLEILRVQRENLRVQSEIRDKLSEKIGRNQRENILREQIRTIREELGEGGESDVSEKYREKIAAAGMPDEAKKVALDELKRLEGMGGASPETHVIRNYLDLMIALPWSKEASSEFDLKRAEEVLEADHFGLEKVKKRILEHLAVLKLTGGIGRTQGSILLLIGPPGVGKTSLGQSIARALGRKFVRMSLGGVRDDAEIRGHRRTYIGAMPGRILQNIKRAGERNPVFLLDEIDKLSRSYTGDPASALLETLDPEQNATFGDHYLDLPFDLSKVFFICTANSIEGIPSPLLDRMEVIDLTGYTSAEKMAIAKRHLLPKQLSEHGLSDGQVEITDPVLERLITRFTREAGVRDLTRRIAQLCRAAADRVVRQDVVLPIRFEAGELDELLGPERYQPEVAERSATPGVVTGLAWTPMGGEILFVEATSMPGSGKLALTGQLGDVMKESVQIALAWLRSRMPISAFAGTSGVDFEKRDFHVHVPAGAIPKDGPSAGVAMLVTLASLLTGKAVNPKLAMTGEITLRGAVMPVGGIKEKVIAAHRAGIEKVLLPSKNQKDLREIPDEVRKAMTIQWVDTAADVLSAALGIEVGSSPLEGEGAMPVGERKRPATPGLA